MRSLSILRIFSLFSGVLALAGCATAPSIPRTSAAQHPNFARAMANRHENTNFRTMNGTFGSFRTECRERLIAQSVGPAPLLADDWNSGTSSLLASSRAVHQIGRNLNIISGASFLALGNVPLGVFSLLSAGNNNGRSNVGYDRFQYGQFLYAVRLFSDWKQALAYTYPAATVEARVPSEFSGHVVGTTAYQSNDRQFMPEKMVWVPLSRTYEVRYPRLNGNDLPHLIPRAVWVASLRPVVPQDAVVDTWQLPTHRHPEVRLQKISRLYPKWTFVLSNGKGGALLYRNGVETRFSPHHS